MIVDGEDRVLVQGITGKQGTFWTEHMQAYGTRIVGGVNPAKAGTVHCGVPVHASARAATASGAIEATVLFIPPLAVRDAALDAIGAGIRKLVVLTEHIPVQDVMYFLAAAREAGAQILRPPTPRAPLPPANVSPDSCRPLTRGSSAPGRIGVISRSGSLGTLLCLKLVEAGFGQSAFIGIGGDPIIGTTTLEALETLDRHGGTEAIVVVGEIGGAMEEEAAEYAATMKMPVIAFIAGGASPPGRKMGHAGAIVTGGKGTYESKRKAFERAGVRVLDTPSDVGLAVGEALAGQAAGET